MAELNAILDVMKFWPLQLAVRRSEPFSHKDWLFEIKYDGFRAIAQVEQVRCKLVSRNGNEFKSFLPLSESIGTELKRSVILDGEIVCLDADGKCLFYDLPFRKGQPRFVAFDLPHCDGQDLTYSPLVERKHRLRAILPRTARISAEIKVRKGGESSAFANQDGCDLANRTPAHLPGSGRRSKLTR